MAIASFHKFWSNEAISYIAAAETMSPREFSRGMSWFGGLLNYWGIKKDFFRLVQPLLCRCVSHEHTQTGSLELFFAKRRLCSCFMV